MLCASPALAIDIEVEILGVEGELADNVRAMLDIVELAEAEAEDAAADAGEGRAEAAAPDPAAAADDDIILEPRLRRAHNRSRGQIEAALRPFGFYEPTVRSSLTLSDGVWLARYEIEPGEPVRIDEVDLVVTGEGENAAPVQRALDATELARGQVLRHSVYDATKSRLFDAAYNAGFIDAAYTRAELRVQPSSREADVHLHLDTGPRYYFGDVVIEQDILNDAFVERFVEIEPGEPFNPDRLIDLQLALGDSGYFGDVNIDVLRAEAVDRHIPVVARTTPRPNQSFTVGVGYGTDTGPRARIGVELRRLNRRGHRFQADMRTSARETSVAGEYRVPIGDLNTDYISYRASLGQEEIGDFDVLQASLGASWNDVWKDLQRSVYLEARREDFAVVDTPEASETALYAGFRLGGKWADDPLFTRRGHAWSADVRGGSEQVAGSASFVRLRVDGEYIRPLGERARLLARGEYGAMRIDDFERLVPSQRFFAGGDRSVRGYEYESLGPKGPTGGTVGGRYLLVASVEADYLFFGDFGGALFYDVGNASHDPVPDLMRGAGIGFRWRSPVGMVRIDLAHPFDDPDTSVRLHLSIGAAF